MMLITYVKFACENLRSIIYSKLHIRPYDESITWRMYKYVYIADIIKFCINYVVIS